MTTLTLGHDTASDLFPSYTAWLKELESSESNARSFITQRMPLESPLVIECIAFCLHLLWEGE